MATLRGVNNTLQNDPTPANITDPGLLGGRVRCMLDTYEASAADIADVILMGKALKKGARVIGVLLTFDALGGSSTLDVGDAEDPNRYIDAEDTSSQGSKLSSLTDGANYEVDESETNLDSTIQVTVGGAAITGTIKIAIFYTED